MIKIFIPLSKGRVKSNIRGFWHDKSGGKVYYDYLKINELPYTWNRQRNKLIRNKLNKIRFIHNQEALFFTDYDCGFILNKDLSITELLHRIYKEVRRQDLRKAIKEALSRFNGCTIYNKEGRYFIEVFTSI